MKYKHNDYYGYINKIQEQAIRNPQGFGSDDSKASEARQGLYNNGALSGPIRGGDLNTFYNLLTTPEKINGRAEALSTDSYMAILKQGNRPGHKLRFSNDGFTKFNNQGVENKFISDMLEKAKTGKISKQDFVKSFNDLVKPYNGESAIIKGDEIIIPHPFVLYKNGGKLNK